MPEASKNILLGLNKMLEANDRLHAALDATKINWDRYKETCCWVDMISEPTKLLADHRLEKVKNGKNGGS